MLIKDNKGLTLIMLVVTVTVFIILSTVVYLWIDPAAIVKDSRDKRRTQDILMLSNAFVDYSNSHKGTLPIIGEVTTSKKVLCSSNGSSLPCDGDTETCLVIGDEDFFNEYLPSLPVDPEKSNDENTGYYITKDTSDYLIIGSCNYEDTEITYNTTLKVSCDAYAGGNCWYYASATGKTCDQVCSDNSLSCVSNVGYIADSNCDLNKVFGSCSYCFNYSEGPYSPGITGVFCLYDDNDPAVVCGVGDTVGYRVICPCQ